MSKEDRLEILKNFYNFLAKTTTDNIAEILRLEEIRMDRETLVSINELSTAIENMLPKIEDKIAELNMEESLVNS